MEGELRIYTSENYPSLVDIMSEWRGDTWTNVGLMLTGPLEKHFGDNK